MPIKKSYFHPWPLIGHQSLGDHLGRILRAERLPRLVFMSGPEHVGKTTAALLLAQTDLCQAPQSDWACGRCSSCRQVVNRQHPQGRVLDGETAGRLGVEDVRGAIQDFQLRQWTDGHRWLIILKAERLTEAAVATVLKSFEELPPGVHVVITADQPDQVLPTLRSRTTEYRWHLVPREQFPGTDLTPARQRRLLDRAAGRPGVYLQALRDPEGFAREKSAAARLVEHLDQGLAERPAKEELVSALDLGELVIREIVLTQVHGQRVLWPEESTAFRAAARRWSLEQTLNLASRYLQRHQLLAANVQAPLLYDDLQLP